MGMFMAAEGQVAITVENGVYKEADLYTRDGYLYAKSGAGFVRIYADGSTTKSKCRIDVLHFDGALFHDRFNRLCDASVAEAKAISADKAQLLIGGPSDG